MNDGFNSRNNIISLFNQKKVSFNKQSSFESMNSNYSSRVPINHLSLKEILFKVCTASIYKKILNHKIKIESIIETKCENLCLLNINIFNEIYDNLVLFINNTYFKTFLINSNFKELLEYVLISLDNKNDDDFICLKMDGKSPTKRMKSTSTYNQDIVDLFEI